MFTSSSDAGSSVSSLILTQHTSCSPGNNYMCIINIKQSYKNKMQMLPKNLWAQFNLKMFQSSRLSAAVLLRDCLWRVK